MLQDDKNKENDTLNTNKSLNPAFQSKTKFFIGIFWLIATIIPSAAIGPLVLSLPAKSPYVAMSWRTQTSICIMVCYMVYYY
mmetsp:Transcript_5961/g.5121  ORF Transcript_5961/g.5121 Transcript_5961/m.5121 type:complete len:82 (+) Transcript_5961:160-405(+)